MKPKYAPLWAVNLAIWFIAALSWLTHKADELHRTNIRELRARIEALEERERKAMAVFADPLKP